MRLVCHGVDVSHVASVFISKGPVCLKFAGSERRFEEQYEIEELGILVDFSMRTKYMAYALL